MNILTYRLEKVVRELSALIRSLHGRDPTALQKAAELRRTVREYADDCVGLRHALLEAGYSNAYIDKLGLLCERYDETLRKLDRLMVQ